MSDISNEVITLGTCFSLFVCIHTCFCFVLIGEFNPFPVLRPEHPRELACTLKIAKSR